MKKNSALSTFIALIITTLLSGCAGSPKWHNSVAIKIDGKLAMVVAGEALNFKASGKYIIWDVSSSRDGYQPAADGTFISQRGLLTVDIDEEALFLYVTARSAKNGRSDTKQIRVVTVDAVSIIPANLSVETGRTSQFVARVIGSNYPNHAVIWRVSSTADGTGAVSFGTKINENGLLRVSANERASVLYVFATSILNLRVSDSVFIDVNPVYVVHHSTTAVFFFPTASHADHPHSNPPVNNPNNNPRSNPPVNPPNNRPHQNPPGDNPHNNPRSNPQVNPPNNRPHSDTQGDNPRNNPRSNPSANTQDDRYLDPPENTRPNNPRSNPSTDTPATPPPAPPRETTPPARQPRR
jgi:hypothetical protein